MIDYLVVFFVSMVPLIELRGAIPISQIRHLPIVPSYVIAIIGNMLPVPIIYLFARKVLEWGADKPVIGGFFSWCLEKGEKGGKSYNRRLVGDCFWHCFCLSEFRFREPEHGPAHLRQVFWIWILNRRLPPSCLGYCLQESL